MGVSVTVKEFEQDFVDNELQKINDLVLMTSSTNANNYTGSSASFIVK